jgi:RluA family pseudouridine synthase
MADADGMVEIPFEVLSHEHGSRADVFLSRKMKRMSRSLAARVIKGGGVKKQPGGPLTKPSTRVFEGERVILRRRKLEEAPTDDLVIPIVHQDEHILAVSKPGNLVVHPTASAYHRTLVRIMRTRLGDEALDLAHRIDKETSGLVLMARDFNAASRLTRQFARREVEKSYLAVVRGVMSEERVRVDAPMRLVPDSETSVVMEVGGSGALPAQTEVRVLARGLDATVVEARPKTGRQHQIRVHLMHLGHPILGDKLYCRRDEGYFIEAIRPEYPAERLRAELGHERQALHAWQMRFTHPGTGRPLVLVAPPPADLFELAARVGVDLAALRPAPLEGDTAPDATAVDDPDGADAEEEALEAALLLGVEGPPRG